jgi:hypothetical protein
MTEPERSAAQILADEMTMLGDEDLPEDRRERVLTQVREAIEQGFTARAEEVVAAMLGVDHDNWPEQLSSSLFNEVLSDFERLPASLMTEDADRLRRTHLAFLPSRSWSAMTVPAGDSYLIAIDREVLSALYFLAKLMIVRWTVQVGAEDADAELHRAGAEIPTEVLTRLARCYFGSAQLHGSFQLPTVVWNTQSQLMVALSTTLHAERFLIHHEAQHITLGHLDPRSEAVRTSTMDASVAQEIEADAGAIVATMARFVNHELDDDEQFELLAALCGVRLLFEAQDLVERSHFLARPPTHPSPQARYQALRDIALKAWVPADTLQAADDLIGTLVEICEQCRTTKPRPRHQESLRDVLQRYPHFPSRDDAEHWQAMDEIEETLRRLDLSIPQHLAELSRGVGAPSFADQMRLVQLSVKTEVRDRYAEHFDEPEVIATVERFGDDLTDPDKHWHIMAKLEFDAAWGARILPRVLLPAIKKARKAVGDRTGLSFDQLARWVRSCVPEDAVLPGVALLRRILLDPRAEKIIHAIRISDLGGMEHRVIRAADRGGPASFVPDWAYQPGPLARRSDLLTSDLVPAAADLLETWLLEADEALWRYPTDIGMALPELYARARTAAPTGIERGGETGSDIVTAYLRVVALTTPRHARLHEAMRHDKAAFELMQNVLGALSVLAGPERTRDLALHLATKAAERGWLTEVGRVADTLDAMSADFHPLAAELRALAVPGDERTAG